jgi:lysozyme
MRHRLAVSRSAIELIKAFEGFRPRAAQLDDGRWTIGYGHTATTREGSEISEADAEALLMYDLIQVAHAVNEHVFAPLNQNEFDALVAFVFNIGVRSFRGSTTLRRLNEGRALEAAIAMDMWRKADVEGERIVVDALVRRRAAEKALFLKPVEGWMPAPTPVLPPKVDYDAVGVLPTAAPVATRTLMAGERAIVERAPKARALEAPEEPSASAAAADAVIGRLESLLTGHEAEAGAIEPSSPAAGTQAPAVEPAQPAAETALVPAPGVLFAAMEQRAAARRARRGPPLLLLLLAIVGAGLIAFGVWQFGRPGEDILGFSAKTVGLAAGGAGLVTFAMAAYFLLARLGGPERGRA